MLCSGSSLSQGERSYEAERDAAWLGDGVRVVEAGSRGDRPIGFGFARRDIDDAGDTAPIDRMAVVAAGHGLPEKVVCEVVIIDARHLLEVELPIDGQRLTGSHE